ncbi:SDR family NAD(P)-dependent oxidoreductase [Novosphingobium aquimarinum]|uniref:SDR family NAD(P)-dependent oxidoreductase n=1 Tax=Novosphingobium aquimarinum TaxID=2682494 RepID=UPI0012EC8044|nr:SDR family oxidoreductase [Novosphingobium aquimarinum]
MKLDGKVAFVTGGARGIGETLARGFAAEGARVVLADIDVDEAEQAAGRFADASALAVRCDVTDRASIAAAIECVADRFGGIDILVNNAARHQYEFNQPCTALSPEKWRMILETNVLGVVNCSTLASVEMRKRGGGAILNLSSVAGYVVNTAYGVTKLAIRGLTMAMSEELAPDNIRVNAIAPGFMDSATVLADVPGEIAGSFINEYQLIHRQGRMGELIGAANLLCSDDGSFITGETIMIGGGAGRHV